MAEQKTQPAVHRRSMSSTAPHNEMVEKPWLDSSRTSSESIHEDDTLLESQPVVPETPAAPPEYSVPYRKKLAYLALYFLLNLSLTLTNKGILQQVCSCCPLHNSTL